MSGSPEVSGWRSTFATTDTCKQSIPNFSPFNVKTDHLPATYLGRHVAVYCASCALCSGGEAPLPPRVFQCPNSWSFSGPNSSLLFSPPPLFSSHRGRGRGGGKDRGRGRWVARPLRRRRIMVKRTRVDNVCLVLHLTVTLLPPPPSDSRPLRCARVAVCRRHCGHRCCLLHGSGTRIGRRPIRQSHHFRCLCPLTSRVRWPRRWPGPRRGA